MMTAIVDNAALVSVLKQVVAGQASFRPQSSQQLDLEHFQITARALERALCLGLLIDLKIHKESQTGRDLIDHVLVLGGPTTEVQFFLGAMGEASSFPPIPPLKVYSLPPDEQWKYFQIRDKLLEPNACIRWITNMVGSFGADVAIVAQAKTIFDIVASLMATGRDSDPGQTYVQLSNEPSLAVGLQEARKLLALEPLEAYPTIGPQVFICYMERDREAARELYRTLAKAGARPWMDKESIFLGEEWEPAIKSAVANSDAVIVCLRSGFDEVGFRQKEVRWAMDAAELRPPGRGFVIPYLVEPCSIPEWCKPFHAGDIGRPSSVEQLLLAIENHCSWRRKA